MACSKTCFALLMILFSYLITLYNVEALTCPRCTEEHKEYFCEKNLVCEHGVTTDMCGCCPRCYKGLSEQCGGIWNHGGFCAPHLTCLRNPENNQRPGKCVTAQVPPPTY